MGNIFELAYLARAQGASFKGHGKKESKQSWIESFIQKKLGSNILSNDISQLLYFSILLWEDMRYSAMRLAPLIGAEIFCIIMIKL
jgi:hypothetical protein